MYLQTNELKNKRVFEISNYSDDSSHIFVPIIYKGYRIALSICYDCNHSLFSRVYGVQGIDLIINSTGGDVIYDKWYKYNKTRAMENFCAIILKSDNINQCYQCGKNRTAQVVKAVDGFYGIDLARTSGPDAIWKNKIGMKAAWRKFGEYQYWKNHIIISNYLYTGKISNRAVESIIYHEYMHQMYREHT